MNIKNILNNQIVGLVANESEGKTNTLFYFLDEVKRIKTQGAKLCAYFYHSEYKQMVNGVELINTLDELEQVKNSIIFLDEFKELFQLENRKFRHQIERVFNLLMHNNNIIILCGVPEYFKQFISSKVKIWVLKSISFKKCVNGSSLKQYVQTLTGDFVGSTMLSIPIDKMLVNGVMADVPYMRKYDKKAKNLRLLK